MNSGAIGLVLSGGGAKGAFQAGVWMAMCELGLADRVRVSGDFESEIDRLPAYDYLAEIRSLEAEGRLAEAEHLADWVKDGCNSVSRAEVQGLRAKSRRVR